MSLTSDVYPQKDGKERFVRVDVFNGGDDMKSNNVRMQINRNLHAQFKRVAGESNNERMSKLLADSQLNFRLVKDVNYHKETAKEWRAMYKRKKAANKTIASALVVSIAVSVCSVAYVCVVNGWFA